MDDAAPVVSPAHARRAPEEPATTAVDAGTAESGVRAAPHVPGLEAAERSVPRAESIIDAASELFADYGYHGASIRDIARHVGFSHSGMLHHFDSKEILLDAVIDRLEDHAQKALDQAGSLAPDLPSLRTNLIRIWSPASPVVQLLAMLTTDAVNQEHPGRFRMSRLRRVHEHILELCFAQLAERGQLRAGIDPAFASRAYMDLVLGHAVREKTVRAMQSSPRDDSPAEDLTKLLDAFLRSD